MNMMTNENAKTALNEIVKGRIAKCAMMSCNSQAPSDAVLRPFFEYKENEETDRYYCGCIGWD